MKMKLFIIGILGLFLLPTVHAAAQSLGKTGDFDTKSYLEIGENHATVTFGDLGYPEIDLVSPFDSTRIFFSVPSNWRLSEGGAVELNFDTLLSGADVDQLGADASTYGGVMTVAFNGEVIGSVRLSERGNQVVRLSIPATALVSKRKDGRHELLLTLNAQFSCTYDIRSVVTIKNASLFDLPFVVSSPVLDLSRLPTPFYLRDSLVPDRTLFVLPENPATGDMQAMLDVVAGFGSMVGPDFDFDLVNAGQLTPDLLAASNLIFVGQPGQFNLLSDIAFPITVQGGQFTNSLPDSTEDGIVELAISPWNASKTIMLVSGNSEGAVIKAAQAVSSGKIFVFDNPTHVYVKNVQFLANTLPIAEDFSFKDLGYATQTLTGIGVNSIEYSFYAAKEQVGTKEGYLDLAYYHSGLLDYGISSLSVYLNDQIITSTVFSKETEQLTNLRIIIPPGLLRFGDNRLGISAKMLPQFACDTSGVSDPWLTILDQSAFHLPVTASSPSSAPLLLDLKFYPNLMMTQSDLGDLAFVLPKSNPGAWAIAADLAYDLGRAANPTIADLEVVFADEKPSAVHGDRSLIVVGRASTLPLITEINDSLPAPFDIATDTANESQMQIIYRIPPGVSVGYLELLVSPYNAQKMILVVSGNDDAGLIKAANTLLIGELRSQLAGLFAVTNGTQVATSHITSVYSIIGTVVPEAQQIVATPLAGESAASSKYERPAWLLPLLVFSVLATIGILVVMIITTAAKNRSARREVAEEETQPRPPDKEE
ncbi:MAG: cellulose biosynthesis cyclic di-GMP-binding regulatory protein BcsB [Chloroflexi bacterium]|nr:cellulose biosynthesis cyclic di-GMP-binding regulatory protein BcsB [Chloroflexota bacterium]